MKRWIPDLVAFLVIAFVNAGLTFYLLHTQPASAADVGKGVAEVGRLQLWMMLFLPLVNAFMLFLAFSFRHFIRRIVGGRLSAFYGFVLLLILGALACDAYVVFRMYLAPMVQSING